MRINPKILCGITDYTTAATLDDMIPAIKELNTLARNISPELGTFRGYKLKRIDYCINFDIDELLPGCDVDLIMELIKKSKIPYHFRKLEDFYNTENAESSKNSFYLINESVTLNCYKKQAELIDRSERLRKRGYDTLPVSIINDAKNIIRFEVQCKAKKIASLSKKFVKNGTKDYNDYIKFLLPEECFRIVEDYILKTIGHGSWFTLQEAEKRITNTIGIRSQKKKSMIETLEYINQKRSMENAKTGLTPKELESLNRHIASLKDLGINPVTIPRERGYKSIPNILYRFLTLWNEEHPENPIDMAYLPYGGEKKLYTIPPVELR